MVTEFLMEGHLPSEEVSQRPTIPTLLVRLPHLISVPSCFRLFLY